MSGESENFARCVICCVVCCIVYASGRGVVGNAIFLDRRLPESVESTADIPGVSIRL